MAAELTAEQLGLFVNAATALSEATGRLIGAAGDPVAAPGAPGARELATLNFANLNEDGAKKYMKEGLKSYSKLRKHDRLGQAYSDPVGYWAAKRSDLDRILNAGVAFQEKMFNELREQDVPEKEAYDRSKKKADSYVDDLLKTHETRYPTSAVETAKSKMKNRF